MPGYFAPGYGMPFFQFLIPGLIFSFCAVTTPSIIHFYCFLVPLTVGRLSDQKLQEGAEVCVCAPKSPQRVHIDSKVLYPILPLSKSPAAWSSDRVGSIKRRDFSPLINNPLPQQRGVIHSQPNAGFLGRGGRGSGRGSLF